MAQREALQMGRNVEPDILLTSLMYLHLKYINYEFHNKVSLTYATKINYSTN